MENICIKRGFTSVYNIYCVPALVGGMLTVKFFPSLFTELCSPIFVKSFAIISAVTLIPIRLFTRSTDTISFRYFNSYSEVKAFLQVNLLCVLLDKAVLAHQLL